MKNILYIHKNHLQFNVDSIRAAAGGAPIIAVVKGDGYGHGLVEISSLLLGMGVNAFCVGDAAEGARLRQLGRDIVIYVLDTPRADNAADLAAHDLIPTVYQPRHILAAKQAGIKNVQVEIDTGIGRSGCGVDEFAALAAAVTGGGLCLYGVYTHFYNNSDAADCELQISRLKAALAGHKIENIHVSNSGGLIHGQKYVFNGVRAGIALYGTIDLSAHGVGLKQVMTLESEIDAVITRAKGQRIGYYSKSVFERDTRLGVIHCGYMMGLNPFVYSKALVRGRAADLVGGVNMLNTCVDITDFDDVRPGEKVVLISDDKNSGLTVVDLAKKLNTVTGFITCAISRHGVTRVIVE